MKFVTIADLDKTIRENLYKVPRDIDFIIGVPRSGIIAAGILAEYLNLPLIDLDSFVFGAPPTGGRRLRYNTDSDREKKRVLVLDDTLYSGIANREARKKLESFNDKYEFIYAVVYHEGRCNDIDFAFEDVRGYTNNFTQIVLYEWNLLQHHEDVSSRFLFDMDGVFCLDPPDERNHDEYIEYIKNATPLFLPKQKIGEIVTYRLSANRGITEKWLEEHGIKYNTLTMFPAQTWDERKDSCVSPAMFKSNIYKKRGWAKLFIESEDWQAKAIYNMTGKPVYCVSTNKMYGSE